MAIKEELLSFKQRLATLTIARGNQRQSSKLRRFWAGVALVSVAPLA
nr:hypothetical protein [Pseudomonas matsuisoli]